LNQNPMADVWRVPPQMLASGLMGSCCTIQAPSGTFDAAGAPTYAYSDVAGLESIQCMDAVPSAESVQAAEAKQLAEIAASGFRRLILAGYYPQIVAGVAKGWRAIVGGFSVSVPTNPITYDILGAETDSQRTMTRLSLRLVVV
jgi:hypothetical protein